MDSPIYKFTSNEFSDVIYRNPLSDEFQFYVLTEAMRQKDESELISVLNNTAHGTVSVKRYRFMECEDDIIRSGPYMSMLQNLMIYIINFIDQFITC